MAWPTDPLTVEVTLALGADLTADPSTWTFGTDITAYTYDRDGNSSIVITRGRGDEATQAQPAATRLTLNNSDGRFTDHNPLGAYYGQLRRNTPMRVRVNPGTGLDTRNVALTYEMPPWWDPSGADFYVPAVANGVLRRLRQGQSPLKSTVFRALQASNPRAHWPCEDGSAATSIAEASGGPAMTVVGSPSFGSQGAAGTASVISLVDGATLSGVVPSHTVTGQWSVLCLLNIPTAPAAATTLIEWRTSGTYPRWRFLLTPGSPDTISLQAFDNAGTMQVNNTGTFSINVVDEPYGYDLFFAAGVTQNGTDVDYNWVVTDADQGSGSSGTATASVAGTVTTVSVAAGTGLADSLLGHIAVWDIDLQPATSFAVDRDIINGFAGELTHSRFMRLCDEEGIPRSVNDVSSTQTMGPQLPKTLLELLRECEAAESGLLVERRTGELGLDSHNERYNQTIALTLNYASGHVTPPLEPTDDDQRTRNDVTVANQNGSSARVVDVAGPLGVSAVGRYDEAVTLNLETDEQAIHHAGWRVNLGTADFLRFPTITVNLRRNSSLVASWLALDIGDRIVITNLPNNISYDDIDLVVEGYVEQISQKNWIITFNCAPYKPYRVGELAATSSDQSEWLLRLAGDDAAAIRAAIDSDDLSIVVDPNRTRFTTVADDFDPDIQFRLGGEVVEVSAIATTAGTYVAAGAMSSADNAAVTPALYAGNTTGDLICVLARIRSASAGTLGTPTDYTRLPITGFTASSPMQLFAKVHDGSESNPTVTPTGGSAGDTVSAVTFGLRGTPTTLADLTDIVVDSLGQSNSSAQDIAYPGLYPRVEGCIVLALGGKDDDWTSVAALSGFTEAVDSSTTTGNDQGLVVDYVIQTTPAVINEGSFTVTGGASAVSEGAVVAIAAGYQTFTVSARSVNGVVKSHAAATRIEVEDAKVLAL